MRFSLSSALLLLVVLALVLGWWHDSARMRKEMGTLTLELQVVRRAIDSDATEVEKIQFLSGKHKELIPELAYLQCRKSSRQIRVFDLEDQIDNLMRRQPPTPKWKNKVLNQEILDCKKVLARLQGQPGIDPTLTQQLQDQVSLLKSKLAK